MNRGLTSILPPEESSYYRSIALESSKAVSPSDKSKLIGAFKPNVSDLERIAKAIRTGDKKMMKTKTSSALSKPIMK